MAAGTQRKIVEGPAPLRRRRLQPAERAQQILAAAVTFFADEGFAAPTRDLAARLGVTQALLYRYFPTKEKLVEAVYDHVFADNWQPEWEALIADRSLPLETRLVRFYQSYALTFLSYRAIRLVMLAGLAGHGYAHRIAYMATRLALRPICAELRHEAGLPDFAARPMTRGEREFMMLLHGGIVFAAIRKHVFAAPMTEDLGDIVRLHVRAFLERAHETLRVFLSEPDDGIMALPLFDPNTPL